jgi:nicotinate-nucleotide pyrophosphorylase (carboxylating)
MELSPSVLSSLVPPDWLSGYISTWLKEDIPSFDVGGAIVGDGIQEATLYCKTENAVVAGTPFVTDVFRFLGCEVIWLHPESFVTSIKKTPVAIIRGPANRLLQGERICLNLLTRISGIATDSRNASRALMNAGLPTRVAGTRKTTPGFRLFEKYALIAGGADTHRYDLSSCVMLKDNHIDAVGDITKVVHNAKRIAGFTTKVEVECRSLDDALTAAAAGADIVMLDNFSPSDAQRAARAVKDAFPNIIVEVSGGISSIADLLSYASAEVDIISMGALTHSHSTIDFSMKINK